MTVSARDKLNLPISVDRSSIGLGTGTTTGICGTGIAGAENGRNSEFCFLGAEATGKSATATGRFAMLVGPAAE